jgi:hypothetical protein
MFNPAQPVIEQIIREICADNADLPIRGDFYRGINPNRYSSPFADPILREEVDSPACGHEWFVRVLPGATEVMVSAAGRLFLGVNDTIGEVTVVPMPQTTPGDVDLDALPESRFHVELLAAIRDKAAVVEQMRANVTA